MELVKLIGFTKNQIEMYKTMAKSMSCGGCKIFTTVDSEYTCEECGRMLCVSCGQYWGLCEDHRPKCGHPELFPTEWDQKKPEPTTMVGTCRHNYSCPVCGFGHGQLPCPCKIGEKTNG